MEQELEDILGPKDDSKNYHIIIESSEDGRILEVDMTSFLLIFSDTSEVEEIHQRTRGWNSTFEVYGILQWCVDNFHAFLHVGDTDSEPLVDGE